MTDKPISRESSIALQTQERMARDGIPPTPENYALYYTHFAGTHPKLTQAFTAIAGARGILTAHQCSELYQAHLGLDVEQRILSATNAAIAAEVKRVLAMIDRSATDTAEYNQSLDRFTGVLDASQSLEQIRTAVAKVVVDTRTMAVQNEQLSQQLASATRQIGEMRDNVAKAQKESQVDPLTEVGNRKFFDQELVKAMIAAADSGAPLTLLMIDIDHFKKFNDTHGHVIGDQVLRLVARTLVENLKGRDVIARYGGEEFVILLSHTKVNDAGKVADQLRTGLASKNVRRRNTNETLGNITISIGAAEYCPGEEGEELVARADAALYRAKEGGRNRAVLDFLPADRIIALNAKQKRHG